MHGNQPGHYGDHQQHREPQHRLRRRAGIASAHRFSVGAAGRWRAGQDEDIARLSPLKDRHINFLGRYLFNIKDAGPGRGLRPLRDPDAVEDAEDEDD
ncbi:hypothetical protein RB196_21205 [Streptomyces sp. PmtA]|uniref:hypothetical protein n=1 Tax=Streptomyces sp. PmtA TaxID=3074275 RepID=UPI003014BE38